MSKLMTGSGYFSFNRCREDLKAKLTWVEFLARHKKQLEAIADIARLDILWDHPFWRKGHLLILHLRYAGRASDHKDAAADLSRIMDVLHCTELHLKVISSGRSPPEGEYRGECLLGKTKLALQLRVEWLPDGCSTHVESRTSRVHATTRSYSVYCKR